MRYLIIACLSICFGVFIPATKAGQSADFVIYSVYKGLDLGDQHPPQKDYFMNLGTAQGIHSGVLVEVLRRVSTYDTLTSQFYKDVTFPIAYLRVIHAEPNSSIGRLDHMLPAELTPEMNPRAVMVGDLVRYVQRR